MRHERFLNAISESEPCGPDLDEIGDEDYMNYILPAEDRIPERYYNPKDGTLFDRSKLDVRAELKSIDSLLERSRDIRLIGLEARFQAFGGSIAGVSDCVQAIAALVEKFWDTLHPRPLDEEDTVRQNLIGALDDRARIVLPLHYATIIRDKRLNTVTWRQYTIATGAVEKRDEEPSVSVSDIQQALGSDENGAATAAIYESVVKALDAMSRVRSIFQEKSGYETAPDFGSLKDFFADLRKLIETSRPELAPDAVVHDSAEAIHSEQAGALSPAMTATGAPAPAPMSAGPAVLISNHREAMAAMGGAESYFATYEPSAPALILVHQARMLVGKPLVEAIEMLLPETAERAVIRFESGLRFQIGMSHLRALTQDLAGSLGNGGGDGDAEPSFETQTRSGAAALLAGVEEFYRRAEPSSPIPMLLGKARSYLNRDFTMILNDLIAKDPEVN